MADTTEESKKEREKRKTALKNSVKRAGKAYVNLNGKLNVDQLSTDTQKDQQRIDFLLEHGENIRELIDLCPDDDYGILDTHVIKVVVNAYKEYIENRDVIASDAAAVAQGTDNPLSDLAASVKASDGQTGDGGQNEGIDRNVAPGQLSGIREIAQWMYRNSDDTGALSLGNSQERFVRHVLMLPARVKLLMYYLVENKRRHNPDSLDIMQSQMNYVPKLEAFKDQMIATKWKFWKRLDGSHVYWHKLEEAMQFARPCMGILAGYGALGPMDSLDRKPDPEADTQAGAEPAEGRLSHSADPKIQEALEKSREREDALKKLLSLVAEHRNLLMKKERGSKVEDSAKAMEEAFRDLLAKDSAMVAQPEEEFGTSTGEKIQDYTDLGASVVGKGGALDLGQEDAEKLNIKLQKFLSWQLSNTALAKMKLSGGIFNTVAGITSLASAVAGIYNISRDAKDMTPAELISNIIEIVSSFTDIAGTMTAGAYGIKTAALVGTTALKSAETAAEQAGGVVSTITGVLNFSAGTTKAVAADNDLKIARNAHKELDAMALSEEDRKKVEAVAALNERVNASKRSSGAMQAAAGYMQMMGGIFTLSGAGATVSSIFSTLGTAISLAASLKEYFERKNNMEKTIDAYIKLDELWILVSNGLISKGRDRGEILSREKQIRVQIRQEAIATLGFASRQSFYRHITRAYAKFLYERAFYKEPDYTQVITESEVKGGGNPYAKMLAGFGVKLIYPKKNDGIPGTDIDTIAQKMSI